MGRGDSAVPGDPAGQQRSGLRWVAASEDLPELLLSRVGALDHNRSKQSILVWVWICVGALRVVEGRL